MNRLYTKLAEIYDKIYEQIFDYDESALFLDEFLRRNRAKTVLEFGCGSGNLTARLKDRGYDIRGVDYSEDMLKIAREKGLDVEHGDMRNYHGEQYDAVLISGRSIVHLVEDEDALQAFKSVQRSLRQGGVCFFNCIDGDQTRMFFKSGHREEFDIDGMKVIRESKNTLVDGDDIRIIWDATYHIGDEVINEKDTLRCYTKTELDSLTEKAGLRYWGESLGYHIAVKRV